MFKKPVALFPISVDNRIFTSENVIPALRVLDNYNTILFFVADGLHLYNRAIWTTSDAEIWSAHSRSGEGTEYMEERKVWLRRLKRESFSSSVSQMWKVLGVKDITFAELVIAIRNLGILFDTNINFRQDVVAVATDYVCSRRQIVDLERAKNLSIRYIIEEIACNAVLKMVCGAADEYYMGSLPSPLLALYAGKYPVSVVHLCGRAHNDCRFRFFTWGPRDGEPDSTKNAWRLVSDIAGEPC